MMISNLNLAKLPECVCEMRYIDSALLTPCAEYQRVLRTRKVEEISATFSEYVANEPRVSYRDGRYHVFDGQNTIEARIACNGGHDLPILCKVFHGLSKKDEALLFAVQTGISTDLTAGERLRADIVAEDEDRSELQGRSWKAKDQVGSHRSVRQEEQEESRGSFVGTSAELHGSHRTCGDPLRR